MPAWEPEGAALSTHQLEDGGLGVLPEVPGRGQWEPGCAGSLGVSGAEGKPPMKRGVCTPT